MKGIDISNNKWIMDFSKVKAAGIEVVYIKVQGKNVEPYTGDYV